MDHLIEHWVIGMPYIYLSNPDYRKAKRYYFLHENTVVYSPTETPLHKLLTNKVNIVAYIFNPCIDTWSMNYFMVMNPYSLTGNEDFRINGKSIKYKRESYSSVYEFLWCVSLESYCNIYRIKTFNGIKTIVPKTTCVKKYHELQPYRPTPGLDFDWNAMSAKNKRIRGIQSRKYTEVVTPDFPRLKWKSTIKPHPPNKHWGQVKLLMSEIDFLTMYIRDIKKCGGVVVYAGAAAGYHIPFLATMFPNILFILYDPSDFAIPPSSNIIIRRELFTNEIAKLYFGMKIFFISDIRMKASSKEEFELLVRKNNQSNMNWIDQMDPWSSLIKFRFPFDLEEESEFFEGIIRTQTFAKSTSAETRFIPTSKIRKKYDTKKYEEQLFFFNIKYRNKSFINIDPIYGINYDTLRVYMILKRYLTVTKQISDRDRIQKSWALVAKMIKDIEKFIGRNTISLSLGWVRS